MLVGQRSLYPRPFKINTSVDITVMLVGPNHIGTHLSSLIKNHMMILTSLIRLSSSSMGRS